MNSRPYLSFIGFSKSGKTASIERLIHYFKSQKYSVITFKHTGHKDFTIDTEGKNTWRYAQAGADLVVSHSRKESAFLVKRELDQTELMDLTDILLEWDQFTRPSRKRIFLLEGFRNLDLPQILCVKTAEEIEEQLNSNVIAIAGKITNDKDKLRALQEKFRLPVINLYENPSTIEKILDKLKKIP